MSEKRKFNYIVPKCYVHKVKMPLLTSGSGGGNNETPGGSIGGMNWNNSKWDDDEWESEYENI